MSFGGCESGDAQAVKPVRCFHPKSNEIESLMLGLAASTTTVVSASCVWRSVDGHGVGERRRERGVCTHDGGERTTVCLVGVCTGVSLFYITHPSITFP